MIFCLSGLLAIICCKNLSALNQVHENNREINFPDMKNEDKIESQINSTQSNEIIHAGPKPSKVKCFHCHSIVITKVERQSSMSTHVVAAMLLPFCCCCLPYICLSCQDSVHSCPSCKEYLTTYRR
ncbi:hypothetical protein PVAND_005773 [Polypedilum vanderplanki]|uniref:LITAF domain-containing protein n=1 Tax=Polypedilum vanderplanki TaxID=319348 RepID=A0A9J6C1L9_POLVA|nr:hypothetical protein PVAND_005773 [Polypedilum vanderplanki]